MRYVFAGYGITAAVLGLYAVRVAWRARVLRRTVEPAGADRTP